MRMWVLEGDDGEAVLARRGELLANEGAGWDREDHDVSDDGGAGLLGAVTSPSLFAGARTVCADNIADITPESLARLAEAAPLSDAVVIARHDGTLTAALRKKLAAFATIEAHKVPKGRSVGDRIAAMAAESNVTLSAPVRKMLSERCGHDLDRVRSVLVQLDLVGMHRPGERQVATLLGSAGPPGVPWAVTDALDRGDVAAAVRAAGEVEPMIVLSWLGKQLESAGKLVDAGARNSADAAEVLGGSKFAAERSLKLARRLGADGVTAAWKVVLQTNTDARSPIGMARALELGLARLAPLWSGRVR